MQLRISQKKKLFESFQVPPDKSMTHRALLLGSIASGPCHVLNALGSEDAMATMRCLEQLGTNFSQENGSVQIVPPTEWIEPDCHLDAGNSGTTTRLITGLLASRPITATISGDQSLSRRPMGRIAKPLRLMGAEIEGENLPMTIVGSESLKGIEYHSPVASAQVKSCLLLAGLRASGPTSVVEPSLSRDHTERMLSGLGVNLRLRQTSYGEFESVVEPTRQVPAFEFSVPGDISSAAFFLVAGLLLNQPVTAMNLGVNPTRTGIFEVFGQIGCLIAQSNEWSEMGEPVADVTATPRNRNPFLIQGDLVPRLIDEIPILAVLATQLVGVSTIRNAGELRVKESDRIQTILRGIRDMGGKAEEYEDGFSVEGPTPLHGTTIFAEGDHRIAMAFAIAGFIASGETIIEGAETIATSYPNFMNEVNRIQ